MNRRGALYIYWGNRYDDELEKSIASIERLGFPVHVERLQGSPGLWAKAAMCEYSPFEETVFLDTDTIVLDDIDFGFEMANRHGLALALAPACYARRFSSELPADAIEYNTGVMFFRKDDSVGALFDAWKGFAKMHEQNDQTSFSRAVLEQGFNPFVLPMNWNFRAHLGIRPVFGPIKVWHSRMPVPENIAAWNSSDPLGFGEVCTENGHVLLQPIGTYGVSLFERILNRLRFGGQRGARHD